MSYERASIAFAMMTTLITGCAGAQEPQHGDLAMLTEGENAQQTRQVRRIGRDRRIESVVEVEEPSSTEIPALPEYGGAPSGRQIANLSSVACLDYLRAANVEFEEVPSSEASNVATPVRLTSRVGGIEVTGRARSRVHAVMDCRAVLAMLAWSDLLREAGVTALEHYSVYRPGARVAGTRSASGHASAMAIDAAIFVFEDGTRADINVDWGDRTRGANPCEGDHDDETPVAETLRSLVCGAVERDLFQVVITPHHNQAHQNHVHLELRPDVNWSFVH